MATGTKACGWPLMANCILHSSFVNCCLPSSHFLLGHGTKPRTGGIRNGTSARPVHSQAHSTSLSLLLSFFHYISLSPQSRASFYLLLTVCTPMTLQILSFFLSLLHIIFLACFTSLPHSLPVLFTRTNRTVLLYKLSTLIHFKVFLFISTVLAFQQKKSPKSEHFLILSEFFCFCFFLQLMDTLQ